MTDGALGEPELLRAGTTVTACTRDSHCPSGLRFCALESVLGVAPALGEAVAAGEAGMTWLGMGPPSEGPVGALTRGP